MWILSSIFMKTTPSFRLKILRKPSTTVILSTVECLRSAQWKSQERTASKVVKVKFSGRAQSEQNVNETDTLRGALPRATLNLTSSSSTSPENFSKTPSDSLSTTS